MSKSKKRKDIEKSISKSRMFFLFQDDKKVEEEIKASKDKEFKRTKITPPVDNPPPKEKPIKISLKESEKDALVSFYSI